MVYINYFLKSCNIAAVYATNRTNKQVVFNFRERDNLIILNLNTEL